MDKKINIRNLRTEYRQSTLSKSSVRSNPIDQFAVWFDEAHKAKIPEINAMTLATADANGKPNARIVLLKGFDEKGFVFFTNYDSVKGNELSENPNAALCFFYQQLERQIRISGIVSKLSKEESFEYFKTRPLESRIGAWASEQSKIIENRELLKKRFDEYKKTFSDAEIPLPSNWGGFRIEPETFEFWQGRENRLHDRISYKKNGEKWGIVRLSP